MRSSILYSTYQVCPIMIMPTLRNKRILNRAQNLLNLQRTNQSWHLAVIKYLSIESAAILCGMRSRLQVTRASVLIESSELRRERIWIADKLEWRFGSWPGKAEKAPIQSGQVGICWARLHVPASSLQQDITNSIISFLSSASILLSKAREVNPQ